jgi:hypothetical protein
MGVLSINIFGENGLIFGGNGPLPAQKKQPGSLRRTNQGVENALKRPSFCGTAALESAVLDYSRVKSRR